MNTQERKSKIALIISMFVFGTIGIFRRYIPIPSSMLAMFRGFIGAAFLIIFVLVTKKQLSWEKIKKNMIFLLLSGALIGFNWICLFEAYQYTSVATATLCYYMAPIFVILMAPVFLKEHLTIKKGCCVVVALFGMVLVSGVLDSGFNGGVEYKGVILGLFAAAFYGCVIIINKLLSEMAAFDKTIIQLLAAAVVSMPYVFLREDTAGIYFTPFIIVMILIVGVVHTGITYALYFGSMGALKAQMVALYSYIDPVVAIILSALFLKENIGITGYVGAVLVLFATMVSELPIFEKEQ